MLEAIKLGARKLQLHFYKMFSTVVAVEGFHIRNYGFVCKELTILYGQSDRFDHLVFAWPDQVEICAEDKLTVNYCTLNLHGIHYSEGIVPYSVLQTALERIKTHHIICHGSTTADFLRTQLPYTKITDTATLHTLPKVLEMKTCGLSHAGRHCSLAKSIYIRDNFN